MRQDFSFFKMFTLLVMFSFLFSCTGQKPDVAPEVPEEHSAKLEWWKDAAFGMFIHWGPVSLKGTEIGWSRGREIPIEEYDNLYKQFNPVNFDADEWVSVAKAAGMKYMVFTSKHHDGFCNWDTEYTDYNIMNSPFNRDIMKELAEACEKQGLALGFYHSTCDWHHPDFPLTSPGGRVEREEYNLDRYTEYLKNQSVEIIENYGPLLVMWYDVPQRFDAERGQGVIDHIRQVQPGILVNNRTGAKGDFDTPEQRVGGFQNDRPWETCMTIANQWAWKPNDQVKSLEQCLHGLIRSVGGDGNLLFNVGPKPDGTIEPLQVERLKKMGDWLDQYGYAVYGTRGGPFKPTDWGVSTRKGNTIYLHLLKWMGDSPVLRIPDIGVEIESCRLAGGDEIELERQDDGYLIRVPQNAIQPINTIIELKAAGDVMDAAPLDIPSQSLTYQREVKASSEPNRHWRGVASVNNGDWVGHSWTPAGDDETPWVEFTLDEPREISKFLIFENGTAVNAFEIQCQEGDEWKTVYKGEKISSGELTALPDPQTAQKVRVVFTGTSKAPGIYEIMLF